MKAASEAMRQCWNMAPADEALAPPGDGPLGASPPHDVFGCWSSSEDGDPPLPAGAGAATFPSPIRLGVNKYPAEAPTNSPAPPSGHTWDTVVSEIMRKEAKMPLSAPLDGWPASEQEWVAAICRQVFSDNVFSVDPSTLPQHHTRSDTDILTAALKHVGAVRVSCDEFWTLDEEGQPVTI